MFLFSGKLDWQQGLVNVLAQFVGAILGAGLVEAALPMQTGLGSNKVAADYSSGQAFIGEFMGTLLLCIVVFQTACIKLLSNIYLFFIMIELFLIVLEQ